MASAAEELLTLSELLDKGIISQSEYEALKGDVLLKSGIGSTAGGATYGQTASYAASTASGQSTSASAASTGSSAYTSAWTTSKSSTQAEARAAKAEAKAQAAAAKAAKAEARAKRAQARAEKAGARARRTAPQPTAASTAPQQAPTTAASESKNKVVAALLALFFGCLGAHKFYLGYTREGIITLASLLITMGIAGVVLEVIALAECIIYLTMPDEKFQATYVQGHKGWF